MEVKWSDAKDKFNSFFKFTSIALRPYLRFKYEPRPTDDLITKGIVWVGSWVVVAGLYVVFVYLFFIDRQSEGLWAGIADFWNRPLADIFREVLTAFKASFYFNTSFLVLLYFAVLFHAEKTFLYDRFLHFKLSGVIKVLTLGKFDVSSHVAEQDKAQVQIARSNIFKTVSDSNKELISIVSASGWDLFGTPTLLPAVAPVVTAPAKWWQVWKWFIAWLAAKKSPVYDNGYLLKVVSERFRKVQIILLDPDGSGAPIFI